MSFWQTSEPAPVPPQKKQKPAPMPGTIASNNQEIAALKKELKKNPLSLKTRHAIETYERANQRIRDKRIAARSAKESKTIAKLRAEIDRLRALLRHYSAIHLSDEIYQDDVAALLKIITDGSYTMTGKRGIFKRKHLLPNPFDRMTRAILDGFVKNLIKTKHITKQSDGVLLYSVNRKTLGTK